MDDRRHIERREVCHHCPLTHDGVCEHHAQFTSFWKWGLSVLTSLCLGGIALVWSEARAINATLADLRVAAAGYTRQIDVNTRRLDRLEEDVFGRSSP